MTTFLLTLGLFALVVAAMAIGVMLQGKRLSGSCGGVAGTECLCKKRGIEPQCELKRALAARATPLT